ncbi:hypothetical protein [Maridesulfovibrio ferrireducens]|uniref:hypothetical protein n=1 Tax=Maridesulfovibrio ferrireducens TaxID=246191 RepID=UPI001A2C1FCF|nr:hypothetical protein [Maridesulfovibrio ferrireducens]MBI9113227.1 hypothetical protein [Maridesulfovibrio ferrireducens]
MRTSVKDKGLSSKQIAYMKTLRIQIMITAKRTHGWDSVEFHDVLESWGFGRSLRLLTIQQLQTVLGIVRGEYSPDAPDELKRQLEKYSIGYLDKQGRYAWHLMKEIGWDWFRVQKYMVKKYHTTHWNVLNDEQKRGMIAMLKYYLKKESVATENTENTEKRVEK